VVEVGILDPYVVLLVLQAYVAFFSFFRRLALKQRNVDVVLKTQLVNNELQLFFVCDEVLPLVIVPRQDMVECATLANVILLKVFNFLCLTSSSASRRLVARTDLARPTKWRQRAP
jgi:hypothetical protein